MPSTFVITVSHTADFASLYDSFDSAITSAEAGHGATKLMLAYDVIAVLSSVLLARADAKSVRNADAVEKFLLHDALHARVSETHFKRLELERLCQHVFVRVRHFYSLSVRRPQSGSALVHFNLIELCDCKAVRLCFLI